MQRLLVAAAGVHYVAFQLSLRGFKVGLTPPGAKSIGLLAANPATRKSIAIRVKTSRWASRESRRTGESWFSWRAGANLAGAEGNERFFVILVDLCQSEEAPDRVDPHAYIIRATPGVLSELIEPYPKPEKGPARDWWIGFDAQDAPKYENRWDHIEAALN